MPTPKKNTGTALTVHAPGSTPGGHASSTGGTGLSTTVYSDEAHAQFREGKLTMLPITMFDKNDGGMKQVLVPVTDEQVRAQVESARRQNARLAQRVAARIGDAPLRPDREMLEAHLDSGYLDVWFENYARWIRSMQEEFVGNTAER